MHDITDDADENVDRLAILVSGEGKAKLLGIHKLASGRGVAIA